MLLPVASPLMNPYLYDVQLHHISLKACNVVRDLQCEIKIGWVDANALTPRGADHSPWLNVEVMLDVLFDYSHCVFCHLHSPHRELRVRACVVGASFTMMRDQLARLSSDEILLRIALDNLAH